MPAASHGYWNASTISPITDRSSVMLSAMLLNGSGLVLTSARSPALLVWLVSAPAPVSRVRTVVTAGLPSGSTLRAINMAPAGRMKVWSTSQVLST